MLYKFLNTNVNYFVEMEYLENEHAFEELQETRANDVNEIVEPNKCEPALGMLFDNHEEMFAFYKAYGKQERFPVKVRSTKKGTDGIVKYATFACGRSGKSESKFANALKPKPNVKNDCDAKIGGCLNEDGKWVLRTLNLQHNHGLSPDKAKYFPCNRRISASAKKRIEMNDCAGIRITQNFNSIVIGAGGYENVPFLEKDCRNFVDKTRRLQLEEGDAMTLLKYLQKKQAEYSWSRAVYKYFEDVITFDTTYLTNKYDMPFAPFVSEKLGAFKEREGMSTTLRSESMNAFFDGFVNSKINLKQFVKQYENALKRKAELEWQTDAKCFSKRTPCVSRYEMERQVEEVYTISKFKEFQEELIALMYCDISDSVGSIYQIIESFRQGQRGFFEVVFEEAECEVTCICSKFQFRGILCRHALAVLIRNSVKLLPERYILSRWRKDVRRCYSKLKIEKAMKDLSKQIRCESVGKTNTGGASCSSNKQINSESVGRTVIGKVSCGSNNVQLALNDPVVTRRKGRPPCLRKEFSIRKKSIQKNKSAQKNKQLVPPYTSQLHYSSPSMTYQGSQSENFQQLLQQQQRNEDNNYDT
ncbi:protein FAR1-RELATED SEQUENCE [Citrus sinensis]|nr:protein FAR1-RELATED SEQUENCE [Citrus sinensis]